MTSPLISFVVPCYKLAHYLDQCVKSILNQSYQNLEILIMDDCSPDKTPEVASAYRDTRVRYLRNEINLGHLRNYNKGINAAKGDYIWLISADDCLLATDIVERYVRMMEGNPQASFIFCPAMGMDCDGNNIGLIDWTRPFDSDRLLRRPEFLATLAIGNCVSAPSGMVRRICYESAGAFPPDLPHCGDWFLWCMFALHGDVAYFCEPMVSYRLHDAAMSSQMKKSIVLDDQAKVRWRVKAMAGDAGFDHIVEKFTYYLAKHYAFDFAINTPDSGPEEFVRSIETILQQEPNNQERVAMRVLIYTILADALYGLGNLASAEYFYHRSLRFGGPQWKCVIKLLLMKTGRLGMIVRKGFLRLNRG